MATKWSIPNFSLVIVIVLGLGAVIDGTKNEPNEFIFLTPTNYRVQTGVTNGNVDFILRSPCDWVRFNETFDANSIDDISDIAYAALKNKCQQEYESNVLSAFNKLASCMPPKRSFKRVKRFDPITLTAVAVGFLIVVISFVGMAIYSYASENSSYNRINAMEERERKAREELNKMRVDLEQAQKVRNKTIEYTFQVDQTANTNRGAIIHMSKMTPTIAWETTSLNFHIKDHNALLLDLDESCRRGKMNVKALKKLANIPELPLILEEHTTLTEVYNIDRDTVNFQFSYRMESDTTKIYEVNAISHYTNYSSSPQRVEYVGPRYVINNSTNNCTMGIDEARLRDFVIASCPRANYSDPALNDWRPIANDDTPTVLQTDRETIIYCFYHQVDINGAKVWCPPSPFILPITTRFSLPNLSQMAQNFTRRLSESPIIMPHSKPSGFLHEDPEAYAGYIALKKLNDESLSGGHMSFGSNDGVFTFKLDAWAVSAMFAMASIAAAIIVFFACIKRSHGDDHHETINIYQQVETAGDQNSPIRNVAPVPPPRANRRAEKTPAEMSAQAILLEAMREAMRELTDQYSRD